MNDPSKFFFDAETLVQRARNHSYEYRTARPFPHAVLDEFLPVDIAHACADEFPSPEDVTWDLYTDSGRTLKLALDNQSLMPPLLRHLVDQFNSGAMIRFLEELTGIKGLVADPYLVGGGLHLIEPGGFLDIHADFNHHSHLDLDRRINVLWYLNPKWDDSWGGELELWNRSMTQSERRVVPALNRCVIFNTTDTSYHGHPRPVACPAGTVRQSLAFYYYSNGRPDEERSVPHSTLYQSPGVKPVPVTMPQPPSNRMRQVLQRYVPAEVKATIRKAQRRLQGERQPADGAGATADTDRPKNHWAKINEVYASLAAEGRTPRPNYTWSLLHAADIAKTLGYERFCAIEFGVAGGNGLVALEDAADAVMTSLGVGVDVVGFDHGVGLPPPVDYRDAPYLMEAGQFAMDEAKLRSRLRHASLRIGLVSDTLADFLDSEHPPIGFVSFDLDYYSSTIDAFRLLDAAPEQLFPRVLCYLDDVLGYPWGESNGPRLAVRDFNSSHANRIIDHLPGLRFLTPPSEFHSRWVDCMYLAHITDHPRSLEDEGVALVTRLDLD